MFCVEGALYLFVSQSAGQVDSPVAEAEEQLLSLLVTAIYPAVAQSGIHLVQIIVRYPRT